VLLKTLRTARDRRQALAAALHEKRLRKLREDHAASLMAFVRYFWGVLEPDAKFQEGWALEAMALHLEAVADGIITRLLINVPPGSCKSLLTSVYFPLWLWSACARPGVRFLALSYAANLTERDNRKILDIIRSEKFQELYGHEFKMTKTGEELIQNDRTGIKQASSIRGTVTGARADIVILDDPNSIKEIESDTVRKETARFFLEALSNRINNMTKSAIIVIQQRCHEDDISGVILSNELPYVHLYIPLLYEEGRGCETVLGWKDPRTTEGECFWDSRFPPESIASFEAMGEFAFAGQYQQRPEPRGGGIFKREYWNSWEPEDGMFPAFEYIIASLDPAYTDNQQNDPSGFVILGLNIQDNGHPRVFLINAWRKHLVLRGPKIARWPGESEASYLARAQPAWGLIEWITYSCRRFKVDKLLVEAKASGITVVQELERLLFDQQFGIELVNPGRADKTVRALRVEPLFAADMVWRPIRKWSDMVVDEMAAFPRGSFDDCVTLQPKVYGIYATPDFCSIMKSARRKLQRRGVARNRLTGRFIRVERPVEYTQTSTTQRIGAGSVHAVKRWRLPYDNNKSTPVLHDAGGNAVGGCVALPNNSGDS